MQLQTRLTVCLLVMLIAAPMWAGQKYGVRVPTAYVVSTGVGQSDDGIPPDPYETFSYDLALADAGIDNFNVMYYTSVLPLESYEAPMVEAKKSFQHGAVLESIMAKAGGLKGDTVVAGIGRVWAIDPATGKKIGGFAAEYEFVYKGHKVATEQAHKDAQNQLTKSLRHELEIRGLKQVDEMKFNIIALNITNKYGIALAQLGFLEFVFLDPPKFQVK
ncbi:MAG: pyruvoyl-dependent arginine decarboxylase [Kiritimatiellia bacterium]|nr:pyruvoyl-dependent arginine decarboxylase [Kiritimatiellia bacterium]